MVQRRQVLQAAVLAAAGGLAPFAVPRTAEGAVAHPFLLLSDADLTGLRARSRQEPWSTWASGARELARQAYPSPIQEPRRDRRAVRMAQIAGAASLAYVLDPADQAVHRATLLRLVDAFATDVRPYLDTTTWEGTVAPSGALFHLVVGLDVIHSGLSATERAAAEATLAGAANWFWTYRNNTNWQLARVGGYGIWAAYGGDTARLDESVRQIRAHVAAYTGPDGAYLTGPTYAGNRLGSAGDRDSKSYYVDVLSRIGRHDFYADPGYVSLIEHYTGYLTTPVLRGAPLGRGEFTFGDSWADGGTAHRSARTWSADRFGPVAAANAAWSLRGVPASATQPLITTYVLTTRAPRADAVVTSRVFREAGAWLHQPSTSHRALCGALWSPTKATAVEHQHKDTNALHLTAYGEHVLRNAGYAGYGTAVQGFSYQTIAQRAVVNNTVLIDYPTDFDDHAPPPENDHLPAAGRLPGGGVVEHLLLGAVDYACGDSGTALPNGRHLRSLVFVRPDETCQGYWVVFDEVRATSPGVSATVAWHPNSRTDPREVTPLTAYDATVDVNPCTTDGVALSVVLGTPPAGVTVRSGPLAESVVPSVTGRYLHCWYDTDGTGARNIVTLLFPYDAAGHPRAPMDRVVGPNVTGVRVTHPSGVTDHALESSGTAVVTVAGTSWRGLACVFRTTRDETAHYLVRRGRSFSHGGVGFQAGADVSVAMRGLVGRIHNPNPGPSTVTFTRPGLTKVHLGGVPATVTAAGIGWVSVTVPAGDAAVELVAAEAYPPEADTFVRAGAYAGASYGSLATMVVKADANADYRREAYLRFDLAARPAVAVRAARLRLYAESTGGGVCRLEVSRVPDTGWDEATLTWGNRPASTTVLAPVPAPAAGAVVDLDVTALVNAVLVGGAPRKLAVRLRILEEGAANSVTFGARENGDPRRRPSLELTS